MSTLGFLLPKQNLIMLLLGINLQFFDHKDCLLSEGCTFMMGVIPALFYFEPNILVGIHEILDAVVHSLVF